MRAQHSDSSLYALLAAEALLGSDTPEAARRREVLEETSGNAIAICGSRRPFQTRKFRDHRQMIDN
jgi:hypothetical protein